jgi:hypothetical protein
MCPVCREPARPRPQRRFFLLRGVVHCATGHNPLRMHGKERKGITYYVCGYRASYGDNAASALGHGKWQYIREDRLTDLINRFFGTYVFGRNAAAHLRAQHAALAPSIADESAEQRERLTGQLSDLDQRIARQLAAIESGVDPVLVGERIRALKSEREGVETALATLDLEQRQRIVLNLEGRLRRARLPARPRQAACQGPPRAAPPGLRGLPIRRRTGPKQARGTAESSPLKRLQLRERPR